MLVLLGESVLAGSLEFFSHVFFVVLDHGFAAAAVSGEGEAVEGVIDREDAGFDERVEDGNDAGCVAARDCDFIRFGDGVFLLLGKFRESVDPVLFRPVGSGGVEDADACAFGGFDDFPGCIIRKTEEHDVGFLGKGNDGVDVLFLVFGKGKKVDVFSAGQAVVQAEARGS